MDQLRRWFAEHLPAVNTKMIKPRESWVEKSGYDATAGKLAGLFNKNFETYAAGVSSQVKDAGPAA